jgi:hypothetical protein
MCVLVIVSGCAQKCKDNIFITYTDTPIFPSFSLRAPARPFLLLPQLVLARVFFPTTWNNICLCLAKARLQ